jgi:flagellum-specific peptidoglycan hydrolase FlgJ
MGVKLRESMQSHVRKFVELLLPYAIFTAEKFHLNPYVMLGHSGMETGWGLKSPAYLYAFNCFGIKAQQGNPNIYMDGAVAYRKFKSLQECFDEYGHMMTDPSHGYDEALPWVESIWHYANVLHEAGYCPNPVYADKVLGACKMFMDEGQFEIEEALGVMEKNQILKPAEPDRRHELTTVQNTAVYLLRLYRKSKLVDATV